METAYYIEISNYYDKDACNYDSRYWKNPVVQLMRQSFREEVKQFSFRSMLEIGCGTGMDLVHFGKTNPDCIIHGIDVSPEMVRLSNDKIITSGCSNIKVCKGSVEDIGNLFPGQRFDMIYIFFGSLNTVENLELAAKNLTNVLNPGGIIVLSYVNKYYLMGMLIEFIRFRFLRSFSRFKRVWGGYSRTHYLPGHCFTPGQLKTVFGNLELLHRKGYAIIHPAWFYTTINQKLGSKIRRILWSIDKVLDKTLLWRFGEYGLLVFKSNERLL
jgi:ubiquinone/menaquinone biosynthesis C-methylase UbiE